MKKKLLDGSKIEKNCPNCQQAIQLVVRTNKHTGHQFVGCPNWPECDYTEPIPEDIRMRLEKQPELL